MLSIFYAYGRTPIQRLHRQQVLGDSQLKLKLKARATGTASHRRLAAAAAPGNRTQEEGAEEMEAVISIDVLRRGGVSNGAALLAIDE
ncbi:hypothetical protein E2C01_017776 [Portunus trituberculatus]|uniref:Uncharacterized protein n=1 Tax=Portunus trituberculatus TaxID=210409 RepID=A0A5B7DTE3_PORTR|nr:hypothetical protein [Portunus trituberculatus]